MEKTTVKLSMESIMNDIVRLTQEKAALALELEECKNVIDRQKKLIDLHNKKEGGDSDDRSKEVNE